MIFKSPFKRIGFTMMEVLLAVFIVGILAAVTIPIISRQLENLMNIHIIWRIEL